MQTEMQRLQAVFEFCELDVARAKRGHAERVIQRFLGAEGGLLIPGAWHLAYDLPPLAPSDVGPLQARVRSFLDGLADGLAQPQEVTIALGAVKLGVEVVPALFAGSVADRYVFGLALAAAQVGMQRIRKCPQCGKAFLKVGRRLYCNRPECERARDGAYWQTYKRSKHGAKVVRSARKRQYEAQGWTLGARSKKRAKKAR